MIMCTEASVYLFILIALLNQLTNAQTSNKQQNVFHSNFSTLRLEMNNCKKVPGITQKCKYGTGKSICNESMSFQVSSSWENDENCKGNLNYYDEIAERLRKFSSIVYNITTNWTRYYDNKVSGILDSKKRMLVCEFTARKYLQNKDLTFFKKKWLPTATRCVNHLIGARRAIMCAMCSEDDVKYILRRPDPISDKYLRKDPNEVLLSQKSCHNFMDDCLGYMNAKIEFIEIFNTVFTLNLCDYSGIYTQEDENKKILPTELTNDKEDMIKCKKLLETKERSLSQGEKASLEASCKYLCEKYFSLTSLLYEDFSNFDYTSYAQGILKDLALESVGKNTFNLKRMEQEYYFMDFFDISFTVSKEKVGGGIDIENHLKDNNYRVLDASKYLKLEFIFEIGVLACVFYFLPILM